MSRSDRDLDDPRDFDDADSNRPTQSNGVATAALVLGIVSLCIGWLAAVPAIVCGVLGLSRSKVTGTGQGSAVAGLVLGGIGMVVPFVLMAILLPAVQKVREAAARTHDVNNFKQVGLAVINQEVTNKRLPPPYVVGPDGTPNRGLSWRVGLLPYLEQDALYLRFKLDQPWNSPANSPMSQPVVPQYLSVIDPPDNQTRVRVFVGPGTLFEDSQEWQTKSSIGRIKDGASNTLLAVETADTVPWAAPQDIPYQPGGPLPALGHPTRNVILVMMADGSVKTVKKTISPVVLHALITRNGGEALPVNWEQ
jgi:hypothetical protein